MTANRVHALWLLAFALSACAPPREPLPITPAGDSKGAAVVRRPLPEPSDLRPERVAPIAPTLPPLALPGIVPAGAIYVCVSETGGARHQTTIEFAPKVRTLCAKHPEMGPCQYEREVCRKSGGRVFAQGGQEITRRTEDEYDRKVMRVRFRAN